MRGSSRRTPSCTGDQGKGELRISLCSFNLVMSECTNTLCNRDYQKQTMYLGRVFLGELAALELDAIVAIFFRWPLPLGLRSLNLTA